MSRLSAAESRKLLDSHAAKLNKKHGAGTMVIASEALYIDRRLTSDALSFDVALEGGLPVNQWTEVLGLESAGKTTFVLKCLAANQRLDPDFFCLWVAAETFDRKLAAMCGVDESRVYLIETNLMEIAFQEVIEALDDRACDMVVIDSYPAMVTEVEDEGDVGDIQVAPGARIFGRFMRKGHTATKRSLIDITDRAVTGVIINQWRDKIGGYSPQGNPQTSPGGKAKNYWMYCRIDVKRDEILRNSKKEAVGQAIKIVVIKMKGARPQRTGVVDFYYAEHEQFLPGDYDSFKAIINLGLYFDVITRSSGDRGNYLFEGHSFRSKEILTEALREDRKLRTEVEKQVMELVRKGAAVIDTEEETDDRRQAEEPEAPRRRRAVVRG